MAADEIIATLRSFLANEFPKLRIESRATNDPLTDIDSIGMLTIASFIEQKWKLELTSDEFVPQSFETLDRMRVLIEGKLGRRGE